LGKPSLPNFRKETLVGDSPTTPFSQFIDPYSYKKRSLDASSSSSIQPDQLQTTSVFASMPKSGPYIKPSFKPAAMPLVAPTPNSSSQGAKFVPSSTLEAAFRPDSAFGPAKPQSSGKSLSIRQRLIGLGQGQDTPQITGRVKSEE
jgi:hypothetical protein